MAVVYLIKHYISEITLFLLYYLGFRNYSFGDTFDYSMTTTPEYSFDDVMIPDEQRLYETLMDGYEKSVRPVINSSTVLMVKFGLHLNQIIGLVSRF